MEALQEIQALREKWGKQLILLTHHYQRAEIAVLGDVVGDSFELCRAAARAEEARTIVFCGVRFMAEAAEVLRRADQVVVHPAPEAGCPMAEMGAVDLVESAWSAIEAIRGKDRVMPVVYMNSSAPLKALVGRQGGTVCTSSNAPRAFQWALAQREAVLFLPDEHLGRNTARLLQIPRDRLALWDPAQENGGLTEPQIRKASVILWKGFCHVHTAFTVADVEAARQRHPGGKILVHPECTEDVVQLADGVGSTSYLVQAVSAALPGSVIVIGTEINLIARMAQTHPDRTILPLKRSLCPNMFRISPLRLLESLRSLPDPEPVTLPEPVREQARLALERMLSI